MSAGPRGGGRGARGGGGRHKCKRGEGGIVASRRGKKRDGSSAVAARRYSRHSIWYFSLCIADSSNCSASRALIYRPAGPLSRPSGSELSFAYSHGTYSSTFSSSSSSFVLPPFAECTSPLRPPPPSSNPLTTSFIFTIHRTLSSERRVGSARLF